MQNEKSVKSYPPPHEKFSYPHLIRVWAFVLLFVFVFAFTGCADSTEPPPPEPATYQKRYGLYLPVERYENIDCEINYDFTTPQLSTRHNLICDSVSSWSLYHLEEKADGEFIVDYGYGTDNIAHINTANDNETIEYYTRKTLNINFDGLHGDNFFYFNDGYYSTYVIEKLEIDHASKYHSRNWTIRAFVVIIEGEGRLLLREFTLRYSHNCHHDELGNEIYVDASYVDKLHPNGDFDMDYEYYFRSITQHRPLA